MLLVVGFWPLAIGQQPTANSSCPTCLDFRESMAVCTKFLYATYIWENISKWIQLFANA